MVAVNPNNRTALPAFNQPPCEGAEDLTIDLRFDQNAVQELDFSQIQGQGKWTGYETLYIDNSTNTAAVIIETQGVVRQRLVIPPLSCAYMPLLVQNPPKIIFTSTGGFIVRINNLNFFLPPCVWSPTAPPGGGGGGLTGVVVTDFSGASPVNVPANANRKWIFINNPVANGVSAFYTFAGGGAAELTLGGTYESGPAVPLGAIVVTGGASLIVYEGV